MIEKIAKIEKTTLGFHDHYGIFTVNLQLHLGGALHQSAGGYSLDDYDKALDRRVGTAYGHEFIMRIINAVGVNTWEEIKGKTIIALYENDDWNSTVIGIKNLPTEPGETFIFKELFT